jgi:hypothetical protein
MQTWKNFICITYEAYLLERIFLKWKTALLLINVLIITAPYAIRYFSHCYIESYHTSQLFWTKQHFLSGLNNTTMVEFLFCYKGQKVSTKSELCKITSETTLLLTSLTVYNYDKIIFVFMWLKKLFIHINKLISITDLTAITLNQSMSSRRFNIS